jgi:ribosomal-protein-alanine N-acetyltransferase
MKTKILFTGYTDTCVMPLCAAVLSCMCGKKGWQDIQIESCGFWGVQGQTADPLTLTVAGEMGLDLSSHRARPATQTLLTQADWIIPQDSMVLRGVKELLDRDLTKVGKVTKLSLPKEKSLQAYRQSRDEVVAFCHRLMRKIAERMRQEKKMPSGIVLRSVTEQDVDGVVALEKQCFAHPWSRDGVLSELKKENGCFVSAFSGKTLVGYGSLVLTCGVGYINNVAVDESYRRQGIADELLLSLEEFCLSRQAESMTLEVRESNLPAISLYEKHGYQMEGCRKNFYRDPTENGLIMTKKL